MSFLAQAARRTVAVAPRRFYASSAQQPRSTLCENLKKLGETKVGDYVTDNTRPFFIIAGVVVAAKFIIGA